MVNIPRNMLNMAVVLLVAMMICELTAKTIIVNGQHALASDKNEGSEEKPVKTINRAAQLAQPGDVVLVRAGTYRERVSPARGGTAAQPIVYMAAPGEQVIIKGSDVWQPAWEMVDEEKLIYRGAFDDGMFAGRRINPYHTPLKRAPDGQRLTLGQVFVDGRPLREVDDISELTMTPATWMVDSNRNGLLVHFSPGEKSPQERLVEVTTRERIFAPHRRGLGYVHVLGFTMEHCANQFPDRFWQSDSPQAGALGCRAGHHWRIEGNTIRFAKSIGIDCGYEGRHDLEGNQPTPNDTGFHVIQNNRVADNGCCGIAGMRSIGTRIVGNVIERNNTNQQLAPEVAGIKVHYFVDGLIEGNLVRNNDAYGIWLDNVYRNARISRNVVIGNRGSAVFVELGEGPVQIDNNVLAYSRPSFDPTEPRADGLYTHDASGINFVHNLVFGCERFGSFHRKMTNRPRAGSSHTILRHNIFVDNKLGHINLPYPGPDAVGNRIEQNLFGEGGKYFVNPWGGTPKSILSHVVEKTLGTRPKLWNNVAPGLAMEEWQKLVPEIRSNAEVKLSATLSNEMILTVDIAASTNLLAAEPSDKIEQDLLGNALPQQGAIVGPLQRLTHGTNTLRLWPLTRFGRNDDKTK